MALPNRGGLQIFNMAHTYILELADGSYYIGSTGNLKNRLKYHQTGKVRSTKHKLPVELVYQEEFPTRGKAQSKEYQIKKWKKRKSIERLINTPRSSNG